MRGTPLHVSYLMAYKEVVEDWWEIAFICKLVGIQAGKTETYLVNLNRIF